MNRTYRNKFRPAYIDAVHAEVLREVKEHGWGEYECALKHNLEIWRE